jgi:hypothetical protein
MEFTTTTLATTRANTTVQASTIALTEERTASTEETSIEETTTQRSTPHGIAEIVAFYNDAANRVKTQRLGYTQRARTIIDSRNMQIENRALNAVAPGIIRTAQGLWGSWSDPEVIARGACHNEFFASGQSWSSRLQPGWVQSATITATAAEYQIRIVMQDERVPELPANQIETRHGQVMKAFCRAYVLDGMENLPVDIHSWDTLYTGSYIEATVCRESGNLKHVRFYLNTQVSMGARAVGITANAMLPIAQEYVFTLNYR